MQWQSQLLCHLCCKLVPSTQISYPFHFKSGKKRHLKAAVAFSAFTLFIWPSFAGQRGKNREKEKGRWPFFHLFFVSVDCCIQENLYHCIYILIGQHASWSFWSYSLFLLQSSRAWDFEKSGRSLVDMLQGHPWVWYVVLSVLGVLKVW